MVRRSDDDLIALIKATAKALGRKSLSIKEFQRATGVQASTVKKRFVTWNAAIRRAGLVPTEARKKIRDDPLDSIYRRARHRPPKGQVASQALGLGRPVGDEVLMFEPQSELGLVLCFGVMAQELGFRVLRVDGNFPDMIAWRRLPQTERWEQVRVEFELRSREYLRHGHALPGGEGAPADLIVCWEHNWPECPIEVLEIRNLF